MRRLLKLIGIGTISLFLWAADTRADELADPVEILTDDGKAIGELPAERNYIPFDAQRGDARMGVTTLGDKLCSSSDDGRTWTSRDLSVGAEGFGVIADDVLVLFAGYPNPVTMRSTDLGRTWSEPAPVDIASYEAGGGGWTHVSQLPNGPALMTVQLQYRADAIHPDTGQLRAGAQPGIYDHVYRSTDGGRTWGEVRYRVRRIRDDGAGTYATNAVLADGTILSVCGKNRGNRAIAIRWRLPAAK